MIYVPLTQNHTAVIDDEDARLVLQYKWHIFNNQNRGLYAVAGIWTTGKVSTLRMHRLVLRAGQNDVVDHINRDGLDNRKSNLRMANRSLNAANSKHRADRRSPFRGVYQRPRLTSYRAQIRVNGRLVSLGSFVDPVEAAKAYDAAALQYFGDFAVINFPTR